MCLCNKTIVDPRENPPPQRLLRNPLPVVVVQAEHWVSGERFHRTLSSIAAVYVHDHMRQGYCRHHNPPDIGLLHLRHLRPPQASWAYIVHPALNSAETVRFEDKSVFDVRFPDSLPTNSRGLEHHPVV